MIIKCNAIQYVVCLVVVALNDWKSCFASGLLEVVVAFRQIGS